MMNSSNKPDYQGQPSDLPGDSKRINRHASGTGLFEIVEGFREMLQVYRSLFDESIGDDIDFNSACCKCVPGEVATSDIQKFLYLGKEFEDDENFRFAFGCYVSSLMNRCQEREIELDFSCCSGRVNDFAWNAKDKIITAKGIFGDGVGNSMKGTSLYLNGDVGYGLGYDTKDSYIRVNGNAGLDVGVKMKDSSVYVKHNVGSIGDFVDGSSIFIEGNLKNRIDAKIWNGIIHVRGNLPGIIEREMTNSQINIDGDYGEVRLWRNPGFARDYKIFHKGRLIVEDGRDTGQGGRIIWMNNC